MTVNGLERIRVLFAQEADQRLGRLGQLVLELEQGPLADSANVIIEIFREVHTLKGSAAVVGFERVGRYAHAVEERLGQLRSALIAPTPEIVDALLVAIDRLGALIAGAIAGDSDSDSEPEASLASLDAAFAAAGECAGSTVDDRESGEVATGVPPAQIVEAPAVRRPSMASSDIGGTVMVPVERLDELVRMVGEAASAHLRIGRILADRLGVEPSSVAEYSELSRVLNGLQDKAMRTRMVPVSTITDQLQRAVRDAARSLDKTVRWEMRGESTELDRGVLHQLSDALLHLVRNAVDHGLDSSDVRVAAGKAPEGSVRLHAMQLGSEVIIAVSDDGAGIDLDRVRERAAHAGLDIAEMSDDQVLQLIFRPGFSTARFVSDISGRGVGLDAVRACVEAARGRVEVRSIPGEGSEFRLIVPITLAVLRCLLVEAGGQRYALPLHRVALARADDDVTGLQAEGRRLIRLDGETVPICELSSVVDGDCRRENAGTIVVVNGTVGRHAFVVDRLVGQRDVVVKGLSALVPRLEIVAGASVEPDGSILLVLDPPGLIERARRLNGRTIVDAVAPPVTSRRSGRILVVDDALTIRELQRAILKRAGFDVEVASDGVEALALLDQQPVDLVLTDVEMPRMDGFTLTAEIRARPTIGNTAVLILTSLESDEDRRRGLDAGADGYIVKSAFDERGLLAAVDRLLGDRR